MSSGEHPATAEPAVAVPVGAPVLEPLDVETATFRSFDYWVTARALKFALGMQGGFYYARLTHRLRGTTWEASARSLELAIRRVVEQYQRSEPVP